MPIEKNTDPIIKKGVIKMIAIGIVCVVVGILCIVSGIRKDG